MLRFSDVLLPALLAEDHEDSTVLLQSCVGQGILVIEGRQCRRLWSFFVSLPAARKLRRFQAVGLGPGQWANPQTGAAQLHFPQSAQIR